jgi:hypothetical protein
MARRATDDGVNAFERLQESLGTALELARELAGNELLGRLIAVFRNMPLQDRSVIVGILEREVAGRMLSRATEKAVQQETHVNPNARLYVRAHSSGIDSRIFDRDEMMIADVRAMRIAGLVRHVPQIYELWKDALREAMQQVDEATRANAEQLLRDGLAAIAEARATEPATEPTDTTADGTTGTKRS